jgi:hypothetical protein
MRAAMGKTPKQKQDDPAQSRAFIEKAKELEAANGRGKADTLIGTLARMKPEPRKKPPGRSTK